LGAIGVVVVGGDHPAGVHVKSVDIHDALIDHFPHQGRLVGQAIGAHHVDEVGAGHQQLTGSRRTASQHHGCVLAQADIRADLHIPNLGGQAQAGQLDVLEITELDHRAGGVQVVDAVQRRVTGGAGHVQEHGSHAVVVAVVVEADFGVEVDVPAHPQAPL